MFDWTAAGVVVAIISVVLIEIAQQKKTSEAWGELSATLRELKAYFEKEQEQNKENYKELCGKLSEHENAIQEHDIQIALLKNRGEIR